MNKQTRTEKEIRLANISDFNIELREGEAEGGKMVIEGYAAVFESEANIGGYFIERIERGAFDGANMKDVPLKYNHSDAVPILARTRNGSLELTVDEKGLFIRAELIDTQDSRDMYKRIKAGLIDKMSFAFTIADGGDAWEKGETPKRSIKKFDRIFDVSVVDTPAYEDTSINARSRDLVETWRGTLESGKGEKRMNIAAQTIIKKYKGV